MATYIATHEVDDVEHWLSTSTRTEVFGNIGVTHRTFRGAPDSKLVGLILEIPDMEAFQALMSSPQAAEAMKIDGVHPETLVILGEA